MCLPIVCVCVYSCRVGRRTQDMDKEEGAWGTSSPRKLGCGRNPSSGLLGQRRETRETPAHGGLSYQHTCLALNFWPGQQNLPTLVTPELLYLPLNSPPSFFLASISLKIVSTKFTVMFFPLVVVSVCTISHTRLNHWTDLNESIG